MIKRFKNFVNESVENKGKGIGGDTDLFPKAAKKQVVNRSIPTMDYLRIGKHIKTKDIDGFIDSVQGNIIYIADRISGEINKYDIAKVAKSIIKQEDIKYHPVRGFEGTPTWAKKQKIYEKKIETNQDEIEDKDEEDEENIDLDEVKESYKKSKDEKIRALKEKRKKIILKGEDYFGDLIQMSPDDIVDFLFVFGEDNNQGWTNQNRALTYALRIQEINDKIESLEEVKESYYEEDDDDYFTKNQIRKPEREYGKEGEEVEIETLETEEETDTEESMYEEGDEEELDEEKPQPDTSSEMDRNIFLFGTEDNPLGINKGERKTQQNESWIKYWEKFNNKQYELSDNIEEDFDDYEEIEEEEDGDKDIRGTEDNPLPDKKKFKMENY